MLSVLVLACLVCVFVQSHGTDNEESTVPVLAHTQFTFLPLTQEIVDKFHSLSWTEKIPYIFTEDEWKELAIQFNLIKGVDTSISYEKFVSHIEEFSDPLKIFNFWEECDSDKNGHVDMMEYVYCRGDFDQNGDPYDMNEYEIREANLLSNFQPILEYDEDGIIID